jgi:hypothetical protein
MLRLIQIQSDVVGELCTIRNRKALQGLWFQMIVAPQALHQRVIDLSPLTKVRFDHCAALGGVSCVVLRIISA